jgi:hypothetical protein
MICWAATAFAQQQSIDLAWDWDPGNSGHTAGPNGDVAFEILICAEKDTACAYGNLVADGIDDCWWNIDHYSCQASVSFTVDSGMYYLIAFAYLVESPPVRSSPSNQVAYAANFSMNAQASGSGSGGGCLIETVSKLD